MLEGLLGGLINDLMDSSCEEFGLSRKDMCVLILNKEKKKDDDENPGFGIFIYRIGSSGLIGRPLKEVTVKQITE